MLESSIPAKTEAGRLEIDERKLKIGARQRMVLISINGERTVANIRKQFAAIPEIDRVIEELLGKGLIEYAASATAQETFESSEPVSAATREQIDAPEAVSAEPWQPSKPKPVAHAISSEAVLHAREYMSRLLSAKVGLRAFLINQKIDKCDSREGLLELLPEFRRLLRKNLDAGKVAEFNAHAEELIGAD